MTAHKIGLVGCGQMGYALIKGITARKRELVEAWYVHDVNPDREKLMEQEFGAQILSLPILAKKADVILLAVKPAQVAGVLREIAREYNQQLILSIAAGITIASMEALLPENAAVIRVMPNMATMVGEAMAVASAGKSATGDQMQYVCALLEGVGKIKVLPESYMDTVTAVSGSGPAYLFLMAEAFIEAAVEQGLSFADAQEMVVQTLKGSIALIEESGEDIAVLKHRICSPGGTTIAAVRKLEASGIREGFFSAIEAAARRSGELAQKM